MTPRALRYFSTSVALLCLIDLLLRVKDFTAHYTDSGVVPFTLRRVSPVLQSEFLQASSSGMVFLFVTGVISSLFLAWGKKPLISSTVLWLSLISLQARNTYIAEGFDVFIRILLFWVILFHLERMRSKTLPFSLVKLGYLLQIAQTHLYSGIFKLRSPLWQGPDALQDIFQTSMFPRQAAVFFLDYPLLTSTASAVIPYLLVATGFLLLLPNQIVRTACVIMLVCFHLSNAVFLDVGLFSYAGMAACIPLLQVQAISVAGIKEYFSLSWTHKALLPVVLALSLLILDINAKGLVNPSAPSYILPASATRFTEKIGFRQRWALFTDVSQAGNGYFEVQRINSEGSQKIFSSIPEQTPFLFRDVGYPSHRWKKFLLNLENPHHNHLRQQFVAYLCRTYAEPSEIVRVLFHPGTRINKDGSLRKLSAEWQLESSC